jgi:hypothetical protein
MSNASQRNTEPLPPEAVRDVLLWAHATQSTTDLVSRVLRLHALTEHYLDRAIKLHLRDAQQITDDARFTYHHKRILVSALGAMPESVDESLKRLSALRNKCAHSAFPSVTVEDVLYAARPIQTAYDLAMIDHRKDGVEVNEFGAYAWALFSEMTLHIAPLEIVLGEHAV